MKLGIGVGYSGANMRLPVEKVQLAERLGYDSVWTAEAYGSDAITPLAYLAAVTSRIRLGTGIIQLAARSAAATAMSMQTLDALAGGGRAILGIGVSGPQIVEGWYGQPWGKPYWRLRDYISIIRKISAREAPVTHDGREISLPYTGEGALGIGKPLMSILHTNPNLPIWLGSGSEANVRLAAELGDGLLPLGFVPSRAGVYRTSPTTCAARCVHRSRGLRSTSGVWATATSTSTRSRWNAAATAMLPRASRISFSPVARPRRSKKCRTNTWTRACSSGRRTVSASASARGRTAASPASP
jgi:F420-dependent oxidoreductase-like protein